MSIQHFHIVLFLSKALSTYARLSLPFVNAQNYFQWYVLRAPFGRSTDRSKFRFHFWAWDGLLVVFLLLANVCVHCCCSTFNVAALFPLHITIHTWINLLSMHVENDSIIDVVANAAAAVVIPNQLLWSL